ncbi:HPP family protein [Haloarchaeobius sp. DFWS5]|uniref:HPP family protein n=1 Tax=Haloarchaeobius sp. DFWS5 TaxID=3446114 RepID=UPI003EB9C868
MLDELRTWYYAAVDRLRRAERREVRDFRRWVEDTNNLVHLSALLLVPFLIAVVTAIANREDLLPFVLFPPLASGTYSLFADPEGKYASAPTFVGGLTAGAFCGTAAIWVALHTPFHSPLGSSEFIISPATAAIAVFLTAGVTWAFHLEQPSAFSTALLALIAPALSETTDFVTFLFQYTGSVFAASAIVAAVFHVWKRNFYRRRARYLYQTTKGDDHVLVPVRGDHVEETAMFAGRIAAAHDAGKVVLLDVVSDDEIQAAESAIADAEAADSEAAAADAAATVTAGTGESVAETDAAGEETDTATEAEEQVAGQAAMRLERLAGRIRTKLGVPCEVVVATESANPANDVLQTAQEANCDLIVTPYEESRGSLSPFVKQLFDDPLDVIAFRSCSGNTRWRRALVAVARAGENAHAMLDFAQRVTGRAGELSVCTCIDTESRRWQAEQMLHTLVDPFDATFETRVSRTSIRRFLTANAPQYDLVVVGASTDRTAASRFIAPPTFEKIRDVEADVAIVHRGS